MAEPFPLEPSLWAATAPPAPVTPPLEGNIAADVVVVGAGYAGMSTALHLAERGTRVVVLEAHEPGWGGSGRNGGQVIPGLKYDPDELEEMFGPERGRKLVDFVGGSADTVFDLIEKHTMNVPLQRKGWIQGAHTEAGLDIVKKRAAQWASRGVDGARELSAQDTGHLIGTDKYLGGWVDPRGGAVQPLAYARELARVAMAAGAAIHGESPVSKLERAGGKWVATALCGASVTADRAVVCTNGYTGELVPTLRTTVIAPNSFQVATIPLSDNIARSILPEWHVTSDTRQLLFYFRRDHTNRFIMGGRGPFREPNGPQDWDHLERIATKLFPQLKDIPIEFRWCGRVTLTRDFLPHLHEPEPGLLVDIGCMGRGVGLQSAMGRAMAEYVATGNTDALPLPLVPMKALPFHALHRAYMAGIIAWYRMQDGGLA
ncbi:MAG TPA: FAD-binding oxidoreductase [Bradyrhizobium sp.]|uniref:NAD(P)/FAD-dependent oxidoreductase n=1 Tax=Bradyrhizobium sp. TaxID=376 RepID=UPI002B6FBB7B|nr:FAD-binding oxidoreductase [Bradyrhizobium sp.]HLZ02115.1 FAD-binding oxidoreductase [Bradyrhizobium sp.]